MVKRYQSVLLGGSICPGIIPIRVGQLPQKYEGHVEMEWVVQHTPEYTIRNIV